MQTHPHTPLSAQSEAGLRSLGVWSRMHRGRLPKLNPSDPAETRLCLWLNHLNETEDASGLSSILNSVFPEWRRVRVSTFDIRLHEVIVLIGRTGSVPSPDSEDERERSLALWLCRKSSRAADGTILLAESRALDANVPGWRKMRSNSVARVTPISAARGKRAPRKKPKRTWDERLEELRDLYSSSHRTPIRYKPDEQALAQWLVGQQGAIRKGSLSEEKTLRLLLVLGDTMSVTFKPNEERFEEMAERCRVVLAGSRYSGDALGHAEVSEWVQSANIYFYRGELSDQSIALADSIMDDWREFRRV